MLLLLLLRCTYIFNSSPTHKQWNQQPHLSQASLLFKSVTQILHKILIHQMPLVFSVVLAARVTCLAPIFSLFFLFFPQIFNQSLPLAFSVASARDPPRLAPYNFFQFWKPSSVKAHDAIFVHANLHSWHIGAVHYKAKILRNIYIVWYKSGRAYMIQLQLISCLCHICSSWLMLWRLFYRLWNTWMLESQHCNVPCQLESYHSWPSFRDDEHLWRPMHSPAGWGPQRRLEHR